MVDGAAVQGPEPRVVLVILLAIVFVVVLLVIVSVIADPSATEAAVVVDGLFEDIPLAQVPFRVC
jgi:hypothetical protein